MPGQRALTGARSLPRRPAHRGCRGGWRVRRAKARQSGDQQTAPDVGTKSCRVERPKPPDQDPGADATARPLAVPTRRTKFSYDRAQLLAVRDRLDGGAAWDNVEIIRGSLPAHLIRCYYRQRPVSPTDAAHRPCRNGPAHRTLSVPARLTISQTRRETARRTTRTENARPAHTLAIAEYGADGPRRVECYQSPDTDYRRTVGPRASLGRIYS